jgi:putative FmdB family regulatory protein
MYEYKCHSCGQVFEIIQRFSDEPLKQHDGCGGALERLISAPALQFKGSGWYITDYAKSKGGSSKNGGDTGTKPEGKSETKSEKKSDSGASSSTSSDTKK